MSEQPASRLDAAVARLDGLAERPVEEHVEVFEAVHRVLHESLTEADGAGERDGEADGAGEADGEAGRAEEGARP